MKIILYEKRKKVRLIDSVYPLLAEYLYENESDFSIRYEDDYIHSDLAITYGLYKNVSRSGRYRKVIFDEQFKRNNDVLIMERGFINRDKYHSLGFNSTNGRATFYNKDSPKDRFDDLNIQLAPWRIKEDGFILLCGQVPWDSNVQHLNDPDARGKMSMSKGYLDWLGNTSEYLLGKYNRKIVFRPHPLFSNHRYYKSVLKENSVEWSQVDLAEDLKGAYVCIGFNTNTLVDAVISGVPIVALDKGSMVHSISNNIKKLNKLKEYNRQSLLNDIAYSQWNSEEIRNGTAWKRLKKLRYNT